MVEVVGPDRMRIQVDTSEVEDPDQLGRVADHDFLGRPARREAQLDRLDPLGSRRGRPLLEEELPFGPVYEALERLRTARDAANGAVRDRKVVANEIEFGVTVRGKRTLSGLVTVTWRPPTSRTSRVGMRIRYGAADIPQRDR